MHSSDAPSQPPEANGPELLLQLGRLIIGSRTKGATPYNSQGQPKPEETRNCSEVQLGDYVGALWEQHIPICIEVLLVPDCDTCRKVASSVDEASFDSSRQPSRAVLIERWTMRATRHKAHEAPAFINSKWLLNAMRSQLHFSQLCAWQARLKGGKVDHDDTAERRRKLSRETCNFKKVEANCDESDLTDGTKRELNIVYSIKIPGESYKMSEFSKTPIDHTFPTTNIGDNICLKVQLESLPRTDEIPVVRCTCQAKRRASKDLTSKAHEEMIGKFNDLSIAPNFQEQATGNSSRRISFCYAGPASLEAKDEKLVDRLVDDRMHTPCSESGKHKCSCDEESDGKESPRPVAGVSRDPQKLDDRRLKDIAKHKKRLKKEVRSKRRCDSSSSEDCQQRAKETRTSIPILQAARFDRFRAIGCYRNQTYLTLPVSKIECKSPFTDASSIPLTEPKKTNTISTQTDAFNCQCGAPLRTSCDDCTEIRSQTSLDSNDFLVKGESSVGENGARRKCEEDSRTLKKPKCDNRSVNETCDMTSVVIDSCAGEEDFRIQKPKTRRASGRVDKMTKLVSERNAQKDIEELLLKDDDTVFERPENDRKRQKTYSINEDDYVLFEKCDYGNIENSELGSPNEERLTFGLSNAPDDVPSPIEVDKFRWTFDSAASMVFHSKTGLPLTSSPAPLKRGNSCFDFDDSINGISGIKSALFHPISSPTPAPAQRSLTPPPTRRDARQLRPRSGNSSGLLGSFEESALKGRLEPVATVHGFTAELGASGSFCPPHRKLPVTVFFYAPGGTNAPYMGHINLGASGYRVARSGTIQVSLFNPHGTLVKMFVVLYDLTRMPSSARTFLRQRTLYMPAGAPPPRPDEVHKWLRYLIHLRFMTSKSGKLYLHTDIRILVSRKVDLDTATAHYAIAPAPPSPNINLGNTEKNAPKTEKNKEFYYENASNGENCNKAEIGDVIYRDGFGKISLDGSFKDCDTTFGGPNTKFKSAYSTKDSNMTLTPPILSNNDNNDHYMINENTVNVPTIETNGESTEITKNYTCGNRNATELASKSSVNHSPIRVFGGCADAEPRNGVSYELRSFTYAPDNPKYSPR